MNQGNPIGKRREKQKAETYELILESARTLFETKGFKKSTIRAVATHAEIGLGTIYKHFSDKNALLAAALHDDLKRLSNEAMTSVPKDLPIKDQLLYVAGFNYRYYTSRPRLSREYLSHIIAVEGEWARKIELFDQKYIEGITALVRDAQAKNEISKDKDCNLVTLSFVADYFLVLMQMFIRRKINDPNEMLAFLRKLIDQTI